MTRALMAPLAGLVCLAGGIVPAQAYFEAPLFVMKIYGERGWSIDCTLQRVEDDPLRVRKSGRGDMVTITARGVTSGECAYRGPRRRGELMIEFTNENMPDSCPFEIEFDLCVGRFPAGSSGSFAF